MKITLGQLKNSPFRDIVNFPINEDKVEGLMESIEQTGFWDNILCRVYGNRLKDGTVIEGPDHLASLLIDPTIDWSMEDFQLAYGHHRLDAVKKCNLSSVDIPVKYIVDESMLRIMANENKDDGGHGVSNKLETVRQTDVRLTNQIGNYDSYEQYASDGGKFFDYDSFTKAQNHGIGYRTIRKFLGETWSDADVRIPCAIMDCMKKGYFEQKSLERVPTLGLLDIGCSMINGIFTGGKVMESKQVPKKDKDGKAVLDSDGNPEMTKATGLVAYDAPNWPKYYKQKAVEAVFFKASIPEDLLKADGSVKKKFEEPRSTVTGLKSMRKNLLTKGVFPGGGTTPFDINKTVKEEFFPALATVKGAETAEDRQKLYDGLTGKDMEDFLAVDGLADWEGYHALLSSVKASIEKVLEEPKEDVPAISQSDLTPEEAEEAVKPSSDFADKAPVISDPFENIDPGTGEKTEIKAVGHLIMASTPAIKLASQGCVKVGEQLEYVKAENEAEFIEALSELVNDSATLLGGIAGKDQVAGIISAVMKSLG